MDISPKMYYHYDFGKSGNGMKSLVGDYFIERAITITLTIENFTVIINHRVSYLQAIQNY